MPQFDFGLVGPIPVQPSRILFWWIAFAALTASTLCAVYLPMAYGLSAGFACVGVAFYSIRRHALLMHAHSIASLQFGNTGFIAQWRNGDRSTSLDGPGAINGFTSPWLIVIGVRSAKQLVRQYIVLLPDSLHPDAARRLRMWLRWARSNARDPAAG